MADAAYPRLISLVLYYFTRSYTLFCNSQQVWYFCP